MWFKRKPPEPVRTEMFRDENGFGWYSRTVDKKGVTLEVTDSPLKQFAYALRRARRENPHLPVYKLENGKMRKVPED